MHELTDEQRAIIELGRTTDESILIEALAGTGKTFTLLQLIQVIAQRSILVTAFNKGNATDLQTKMPKMPKTHAVHVKTFHALGLGVIKDHFPRIEVAPSASEDLINQVAGTAISFRMRRAAVKLLRLVKETIATPNLPDSASVLALGFEHDVFGKMQEREMTLTVEAVRDAYVVSMNLATRPCIDFCDMVWAPVALDLPLKTRYLAVIVDELQDISAPQLALVRRMMVPGKGRFIAAGDHYQQLYSWRGSMGASAWSVLEEMGAKTLPLTTTWRCPKIAVRRANEIVPMLRAAPDAIEGTEANYTLGELPMRLANSRQDGIHTFVLSRSNADLVDAALFLWQSRVAFQLNTGKELLAPIFVLLEKLDTRDESAFRKTLGEWFDVEFKRAEATNATAYAEKIEDQKALLLATLKYSKPREIARLLNEILVPNQSGILLSTVHKVKGLEAERVFLLKQTFARHRTRLLRFGDEYIEVKGYGVSADELHVEYVGITRVKEHLGWVDIEGPGVRESPVKSFALSESLDDFTLEELQERLSYVELMATRTLDHQVAEAFMKHARELERLMGDR